MVYTDWAHSSSDSSGMSSEPDGAGSEQCSMIELQNLYSTSTWRDIPCAYDQVYQYLCSVEKSNTSGKDSLYPCLKFWVISDDS